MLFIGYAAFLISLPVVPPRYHHLLEKFQGSASRIAGRGGLGEMPAALLGMLTGVGGGALRDILALEVPMILRGEIYALASLLGALMVNAGHRASPVGHPD